MAKEKTDKKPARIATQSVAGGSLFARRLEEQILAGLRNSKFVENSLRVSRKGVKIWMKI